jgi:hypothetical protein
MPTPHDPYQAEPDDHLATEPLDDGEGGVYRIAQEPVGADRVIGGGEFPDSRTPARPPAPGSVAPGARRSGERSPATPVDDAAGTGEPGSPVDEADEEA